MGSHVALFVPTTHILFTSWSLFRKQFMTHSLPVSVVKNDSTYSLFMSSKTAAKLNVHRAAAAQIKPLIPAAWVLPPASSKNSNNSPTKGTMSATTIEKV
jgi:hypothetical protein